MDDMNMTPPPPQPPSMTNMPHKQNTMTAMHTSFYWSDKSELLFPGWPGPGKSNSAMYILSLLIVFILAFSIEFLSRSRVLKTRVDNGAVVRVLGTVLHGLRMALAYLVMLAVMSYNGGVFLAAVLGHVIGFLFFGSRVFGSGSNGYVQSDLGPMSC